MLQEKNSGKKRERNGGEGCDGFEEKLQSLALFAFQKERAGLVEEEVSHHRRREDEKREHRDRDEYPVFFGSEFFGIGNAVHNQSDVESGKNSVRERVWHIYSIHPSQLFTYWFFMILFRQFSLL